MVFNPLTHTHTHTHTHSHSHTHTRSSTQTCHVSHTTTNTSLSKTLSPLDFLQMVSLHVYCTHRHRCTSEYKHHIKCLGTIGEGSRMLFSLFGTLSGAYLRNQNPARNPLTFQWGCCVEPSLLVTNGSIMAASLSTYAQTRLIPVASYCTSAKLLLCWFTVLKALNKTLCLCIA